jgi:hypothetical protein
LTEYFTVEGDLLTLVLLYAPCSVPLLVAQKKYNADKVTGDPDGDPDPPVVWQYILIGLVMEPFLAIPSLLLAPVVIFYAAIDSALRFQEMKQPEMFLESKVFQDALFRAMVAQIMESIFESGFELIVQTHIYLDGSSGLEGTSYFPSAILGAVSIVQAILLLQNHGHYKFIANRENDSLQTADKDYYVETITAYVRASHTPVIANVMGNRLGKEHLSKLQENLSAHPNLISLCGIATDATAADLSGLGIDAYDAIVLVSELPDKRALSVLNLADNGLGLLHSSGELVLPEGWTEDYDSEDEEVYRHTDGREQKDNPGKPTAFGIIAIANAIPDMGAILSLDMSDNSLNFLGRGMDYLGPAVAASTITSLNIAKNCLNENGGIEAVASLLDKGALAKLDISGNVIGAEQEGDLQRICAAGGIELSK